MYSDKGRTKIGNTPTCEDCDQPTDNCICEDGILWPPLDDRRESATLATSDGLSTIRPACPWCNSSHNPDITCRSLPTTRSEALTVLLINHVRLMAKTATALGKVVK
jgi:hypothetical protein